MTQTIYDTITQDIIKMLAGVDPNDFNKPWFPIGLSPINAVTKTGYRGINYLSLSCAAFQSTKYATFKQWSDKECRVKKGEKGRKVVFWNFSEDKDTEKKYAFLKPYTVFNSEQVEGDFARQVEAEKPKLNDNPPIIEAQRIVDKYIKSERIAFFNSDRAFYSLEDKIGMPLIGQFQSSESYYSTLFHEIGHSTGHKKRCDRNLELNGGFGTKGYAKEELVAELTAAFLCGQIGLANKPRLDHAKYIANWIQVLRNDKTFIFQAAGQAQKATDYILNVTQADQIKITQAA